MSMTKLSPSGYPGVQEPFWQLRADVGHVELVEFSPKLLIPGTREIC